MKTGGIT